MHLSQGEVVLITIALIKSLFEFLVIREWHYLERIGVVVLRSGCGLASRSVSLGLGLEDLKLQDSPLTTSLFSLNIWIYKFQLLFQHHFCLCVTKLPTMIMDSETANKQQLHAFSIIVAFVSFHSNRTVSKAQWIWSLVACFPTMT